MEDASLGAARLRSPVDAAARLREGLVRAGLEYDDDIVSRLKEIQQHFAVTLRRNHRVGWIGEHPAGRPDGHDGARQSLDRDEEFSHVCKLLALHQEIVANSVLEIISQKNRQMQESTGELVDFYRSNWDQHAQDQQAAFEQRLDLITSHHETRLREARRYTSLRLQEAERLHQDKLAELRESMQTAHDEAVLAMATRHGEQVDQLSAQLDAEQTKCQSLSNTLNLTNKKVDKQRGEIEQLHAKVEELTRELELARGENSGNAESAQLFISMLQRQLKAALQKQRDLEEDVKERDEDIETLKIALERKEALLNDLQERVESTEQLLKLLKEDLRKCQHELEETRARREELEAQNKMYSEELRDLKSEKELLLAKNQDLALQLRKVQSQLEEERALREQEKQRSDLQIRHLEDTQLEMQQGIAEKVEKIQQMQNAMLEYTALQKRVEELHACEDRRSEIVPTIEGLATASIIMDGVGAAQAQMSDKTVTRASDRKSTERAALEDKEPDIAGNVLEAEEGKEEWAAGISVHVTSRNGDVSIPPVPHVGAHLHHVTLTDFVSQQLQQQSQGQKVDPNARENQTCALPALSPASPASSNSTDPVPLQDTLVAAKREFFQKNNQVHSQVKDEIKKAIQDEIRDQVRAELVGKATEEMQTRIRKELSIKFKLKLQMELSAQLRALSEAPGEKGGAAKAAWIEAAMSKQNKIMNQLRKEIDAREKQLAIIQASNYKLKDQVSLLTVTLKEKDHLLQQLTDVLRTYRQYSQQTKVINGQTMGPCNISKVAMQPLDRLVSPRRAKERKDGPGVPQTVIGHCKESEFPITPKLVERFDIQKKQKTKAKNEEKSRQGGLPKTKKAKSFGPKRQIQFSKHTIQDFLSRSRKST